MSDTLKARVGRVIAGGVHALLDQIEDLAPEAVMEQAIREAGSVVDEVRHELGRVAANRHLAQQQHASLNQQHAALDAQVAHAIEEQRDDLAHAAVARQLDIEAQVPVLESTLADLSHQEAELRGYVDALLARQREMEQALAQFRRSRTGAGGSGHAGAAGAGAAARIEDVAGTFGRVFERHTGLSATGRDAGLKQAAQLRELEELSRRHKIEERLAQIRAGKA